MDYNSPIDARIIVESASDMEIVSKALSNITFENDYKIIISSLILNRNSDLIKKTIKGADVVLIITKDYIDKNEFKNTYIEPLKDEVGHIERINFSDIEDFKFIDAEIMSQQIENAIIRAGLSSIKLLNYFKEMETQINNSLIKINELNKEINNINSKNYELAEKLEEQTRINDNLQIEINSNNKHIDKLTKKYNDLKSNTTYFEEKQLNEVFSIHDLWMETFNESINTYERIIFATNKFKPENIIIGQGLISAKNKEVAVQWLKVVKTALCFIDSKDEDDFGRVFKKENSINNKKNNISSSEIHEVKEKPIKKEKEDINSRIMNLWE